MMADRLPHACAREPAHVLVHRSPGRENRGWRQVAPLTAGSHEVEQAVQQPPHVSRARPTAGLGGRDQGREQGVLLVPERLPGAEVADKGPVLRCPHGVPPRRATPFPKPPARPLRLVIPLDRAGFSNGLLARLWPSGSVAERIGNAFLERWAEFVRLAWMTRHGKTLFLPEMSPHSGECIAEGGTAFVIPGRAHNGPACLRAELCGKQGHEGE